MKQTSWKGTQCRRKAAEMNLVKSFSISIKYVALRPAGGGSVVVVISFWIDLFAIQIAHVIVLHLQIPFN